MIVILWLKDVVVLMEMKLSVRDSIHKAFILLR